jgi:Holliday junction resolvasome RuvABC endonuclease subunit
VSVRILGVDPGFANIGVMGINLLSHGAKAMFADAIITKSEGKKRNLRQESDDTRRLEQIRVEFGVVVDNVQPQVAAFERVPRIRMNPTATRQCALGWSTMWTVCRERGIPVLVFEPEDIKYEVCKDRGASKTDMVKALQARFPGFKGWPDTKKIEHICDAGGAALLARRDPVVEILLTATKAGSA